MLHRLTAVLLLLFCAACASTGVRVTDEQLQALQPGSTTIEQVTARFGAPTSRLRMADGTVMLMYVYAESRVRPSTFIPVVGVFTGGADTRSTMATLRFRSDGTLDSTTSSASELGSATGVGAGQTAPVAQPRP